MSRYRDICILWTLGLCLGAQWTTRESALAADPTVITNSIGMNLVEIPAGEFLMGAEETAAQTIRAFPYFTEITPPRERRRFLFISIREMESPPLALAGESPRHRVRITKPFLMGQYEVTLKQFLTFYNEANYKVEIERDGGASPGYLMDNGTLKSIESNRFRPWAPLAWEAEMDHPVIYLSWNDAVAFCQWLSKKEGKKYRLPTEAEWEYGCRAGSNSRYSFGSEPDELIQFANAADSDLKSIFKRAVVSMRDKDGNCTDSSYSFPYLPGTDGYKWTSPVGQYKPNAFGLYDMHGNASEWCADWYGRDYYSRSPTDDPTGPGTGSSRVVRGGSFHAVPSDLRCASRREYKASYRTYKSGFRVVCEL